MRVCRSLLRRVCLDDSRCGQRLYLFLRYHGRIRRVDYRLGFNPRIRGRGIHGFDAVSTAAQEARNPKRDMPIGILGSLVFCTILYVLFSYVLSGVATVGDFRSAGREASVAFAISKYMHGYEWLSKSVTVAILAGFSSVALVTLMGQSRVCFSMSRDGLVPQVFY